MNFLPHTAEDYFRALKYIRKARQIAQSAEEARLLGLAVEALRFAAIRKENRRLRYAHLKEMHGQPVYFDSVGISTAISSGGIVDAHRELVLVLEGEDLVYQEWSWENCGARLRFPVNNIDLLSLDR